MQCSFFDGHTKWLKTFSIVLYWWEHCYPFMTIHRLMMPFDIGNCPQKSHFAWVADEEPWVRLSVAIQINRSFNILTSEFLLQNDKLTSKRLCIFFWHWILFKSNKDKSILGISLSGEIKKKNDKLFFYSPLNSLLKKLLCFGLEKSIKEKIYKFQPKIPLLPVQRMPVYQSWPRVCGTRVAQPC